MDYKINQEERYTLKGLPHLARLVYLEAIRPYMDYSTGIVGIRRGISYQSLREELYVEPHRGYVSGSPSKDQMRRAVKTLERAGLISIQSEDKKLILKCEVATWDYSAQNKVATKAPQQINSAILSKNADETERYADHFQKADTAEFAKAATPPETGINIIFLKHAFEKFWLMYPNKQSKLKAWEIFQSLSPTPELFDTILNALKKQCDHYNVAMANGQWAPNWKYANNWLAQHYWEESLFETPNTGSHHALSTRNYPKHTQSRDLLWESCKHAFDTEEIDKNDNNVTVIDITTYRRAH